MGQRELVVDFFAGGGGASEGIANAIGRSVDVAINHDAAAIAMHTANHPDTKHFTESVWNVKPREITGGRPVGLAWFSPDCTHFSKAKGRKPVKKSIRSLAGVVPRFASKALPRVIILENVAEFETWGPCVPMWTCASCRWYGTEGQATLTSHRRRACPECDSAELKVTMGEDGRPLQLPDPARKGQSFRRWWRRMEALGYVGDRRVLDAANHGAPTHRKRLFVVWRRDGRPIGWPTTTHAAPQKIHAGDFFGVTMKPYRTAAECIDWAIPCPSIFERERELAEATKRRIAYGIERYVLNAAEPFIVGVGGRMGQSPAAPIGRPMNTITAKNDRAVAVPFLAPLTHQGEDRARDIARPFPVITTAKRGELSLIAPTMIHMGNGERAGQEPRARDIQRPMAAITAGGLHHGLIAAFLAKHYGGVVGVPVTRPLPTQTTRGTQNQLVAANLIHFNHGEKQWSGLDDPMRTITTGNHAYLVYSFLIKYYGESLTQGINSPFGTITTKDRFGLVFVWIQGEPWVITDIGMRMLTPRELFLGNGFRPSYILTGNKTSQIGRCGNSVPPPLAEAIVRANYP